MSKKLMFLDWDDFINWATARVLTGFIEGGGKGLRSSIHLVVITFSTWEKELKQKEKKHV
jgi:hypothetical protein